MSLSKVGLSIDGKVNDPEKFICFVFAENCPMAISVSKAENGTRKCDRDNTGLNKDGSVDYGIFQINASAHRDKATPQELKDCVKNVLVAKHIFNTSFWYPWVAFNNGEHLKHLAYAEKVYLDFKQSLHQ